MSYTQIYLHIVFAVKKRYPLLTDAKRAVLFKHIKQQAQHYNSHVIVINGSDDHVHFLLRLKSTQTLAGVMQRIKGESSCWANHLNLFENKLVWAKGYYARSVDPEMLSTITRYISSQPARHEFKSVWLHQYLETIAS